MISGFCGVFFLREMSILRAKSCVDLTLIIVFPCGKSKFGEPRSTKNRFCVISRQTKWRFFSNPHFKIFKFNHDLLTLQTFRQSPFASQKQGIFSSPFWAPNAETANIADIGNIRRENPSLKSVPAWPVVGQLWFLETWAKFLVP